MGNGDQTLEMWSAGALLKTVVHVRHTVVCLYVSWNIHSKLSMTFWKHKNNILVSALVYHPLSDEESVQLGDLVWLHELL